MAALGKKTLNDEEFMAIAKEVVPHIKALQLVLAKRGMENLGSLAFSADGYAKFTICDTGYEMGRFDSSSEFRIRKEYGLEETR